MFSEIEQKLFDGLYLVFWVTLLFG